MDREQIIEIITAARALYARETAREENKWSAESDKYEALDDIADAKARLDQANDALDRLNTEEKKIAAEYWKLIVEWVYERLDEVEVSDVDVDVDRLVRLYEDEQAEQDEQDEGGEERSTPSLWRSSPS
jgi:hypothetical protein